MIIRTQQQRPSQLGCAGCALTGNRRPQLGLLPDTNVMLLAGGTALALIALWWATRRPKRRTTSKRTRRRAAIAAAEAQLRRAKEMPIWF